MQSGYPRLPEHCPRTRGSERITGLNPIALQFVNLRHRTDDTTSAALPIPRKEGKRTAVARHGIQIAANILDAKIPALNSIWCTGSQSGKSPAQSGQPDNSKYSFFRCGDNDPLHCGQMAVASGWSLACVSCPTTLTPFLQVRPTLTRRQEYAEDKDDHTDGISTICIAFRDLANEVFAVQVPIPTPRFADQRDAVIAGILRLNSDLRQVLAG